jgi:hypothetical protein
MFALFGGELQEHLLFARHGLRFAIFLIKNCRLDLFFNGEVDELFQVSEIHLARSFLPVGWRQRSVHRGRFLPQRSANFGIDFGGMSLTSSTPHNNALPSQVNTCLTATQYPGKSVPDSVWELPTWVVEKYNMIVNCLKLKSKIWINSKNPVLSPKSCCFFQQSAAPS